MAQREAEDVTTISISADYARGLSDTALRRDIEQLRGAGKEALSDNLAILVNELAERQLSSAAMPDGDIDPAAAPFHEYQLCVSELSRLGRQPSNDMKATAIPEGQLLLVDENGTILLMDPSSLVSIGNDLLPVLDNLTDPDGGGLVPNAAPMEELVVWPDGRALLAPGQSLSPSSMVLQGRPVELGGFVAMNESRRPWNRVRDAALSGAFRSGIYQLGTYPISHFMGASLPAGTRIRFANPVWPGGWKFRPGLPRDTRLFEVFEPGTKRFFAWDAHATPPGAKIPHPEYHINQQGMKSLFGANNISPIAAADLPAARGLRYARLGTRIFLVVGVAVDTATLTQAAVESAERGTPRPVLAQAVRVAGGWGGGWAGAKLMCAGGALATAETGPGAVLGCVVGGAIGGFAGYFGADWIADLIEPN